MYVCPGVSTSGLLLIYRKPTLFFRTSSDVLSSTNVLTSKLHQMSWWLGRDHPLCDLSLGHVDSVGPAEVEMPLPPSLSQWSVLAHPKSTQARHSRVHLDAVCTFSPPSISVRRLVIWNSAVVHFAPLLLTCAPSPPARSLSPPATLSNPFSHITCTIRSSGCVLLAYNMCQRISADGHVYNVSAGPLVY